MKCRERWYAVLTLYSDFSCFPSKTSEAAMLRISFGNPEILYIYPICCLRVLSPGLAPETPIQPLKRKKNQLDICSAIVFLVLSYCRVTLKGPLSCKRQLKDGRKKFRRNCNYIDKAMRINAVLQNETMPQKAPLYSTFC
jgi:hypothetical protein